MQLQSSVAERKTVALEVLRFPKFLSYDNLVGTKLVCPVQLSLLYVSIIDLVRF